MMYRSPERSPQDSRDGIFCTVPRPHFLGHALIHRQPKRTMCGLGLQRSFGRNILELLVHYLMPNKCKKS